MKKNPKDRVLRSKAALGLGFLICEKEMPSLPRHPMETGPKGDHRQKSI